MQDRTGLLGSGKSGWMILVHARAYLEHCQCGVGRLEGRAAAGGGDATEAGWGLEGWRDIRICTWGPAEA